MKQREYLSKEGAEELAQRIEQYWSALGHRVKCWLEVVPGRIDRLVYGVRSDIAEVVGFKVPVRPSKRRPTLRIVPQQNFASNQAATPSAGRTTQGVPGSRFS